jgi:hypothetical protein
MMHDFLDFILPPLAGLAIFAAFIILCGPWVVKFTAMYWDWVFK